jgi:hypothetical protein
VRAQKIRKAFEVSKSPEELLFKKLPQACDVSEDISYESRNKDLGDFAEKLTEGLRDLKNAYPNLLEKQKLLLAQALLGEKNPVNLQELREKIRGRYSGLDQYTVDVEGLRAFIRFICDPNDSDKVWLENVLMFLSGRPAKLWTDLDSEGADLRLAEFARRLNDLEKLRVHYHRRSFNSDTAFEVILLRTVRLNGQEKDYVACIDERKRKAINTVKKEVSEVLERLGNKEATIALLAELAEEHLEAKSSEIRQTHLSLKKENNG